MDALVVLASSFKTIIRRSSTMHGDALGFDRTQERVRH
jgi:hypothetical protein